MKLGEVRYDKRTGEKGEIVGINKDYLFLWIKGKRKKIHRKNVARWKVRHD